MCVCVWFLGGFFLVKKGCKNDFPFLPFQQQERYPEGREGERKQKIGEQRMMKRKKELSKSTSHEFLFCLPQFENLSHSFIPIHSNSIQLLNLIQKGRKRESFFFMHIFFLIFFTKPLFFSLSF